MIRARPRPAARCGDESAPRPSPIAYRPGVSTGTTSAGKRPGSGGDVLVAGYTVAAQLEVHTAVPSADLLPAGHRAGVDLVTLLTAAALLGSQGRRGLLALAVLSAVLTPLVLIGGQPSDLLGVPGGIAIAALAGWELSRTRRQVAALRAEVEAMERAGAEEERRLLSAERRRVARELHDVVSHALTVVVVQAGAGPDAASDRRAGRARSPRRRGGVGADRTH